MRESPSAERIGSGTCPLLHGNVTSPTVTLPRRDSADTFASSTEGPETDVRSIQLGAGLKGHVLNLDGSASPIHFRAYGNASKSKAPQSWCQPYHGADREEPLRMHDARAKFKMGHAHRSPIHTARQKAITLNNSGVCANRPVTYTPLRSCDTSGTMSRSHSTQSFVASTENHVTRTAAPPRSRRRTFSAAVKYSDKCGEVREQRNRRKHHSARKNRAASAQGSRWKMHATGGMRSQIVSASAANRWPCKHKVFEDSDLEAGESCTWKPGRSQMYTTKLSSSTIEHGWQPPSPLGIRPPSRQKEAFPKHLTTLEDDKDVSSSLGSDDATIPPCQLRLSSPHSNVTMSSEYRRDCAFGAASSLQTRVRRSSERQNVDSHDIMPNIDDDEDSFSTGGLHKQCRLDQIHDPEADGFAMLDELAPCPFKIQVTHNDGSPLQLKDLGAVAAKSPLLFPENTPSRILSANESRNCFLDSSEMLFDYAVRAMVSAKRRYSAKRENRPFSSRQSLVYNPRNNYESKQFSGGHSSGVHCTEHTKKRDSASSPINLLDGDNADIRFADSSSSTAHDCASSAILDTNIGEDFLSLFAPPDAKSS